MFLGYTGSMLSIPRAKRSSRQWMESTPPHSRVYVEAVLSSYFKVFKMPMTCRHCDPASAKKNIWRM
jgi:hypothetical protein